MKNKVLHSLPYLVLALIFFASSAVTNKSYAESKIGPISYADAVEKATAAVVAIYTTKEIPIEIHPMFQDPFFRNFFGDLQTYQYRENRPSLGSGVIITDGYILTNYHVIKDANSITVTLADGRETSAQMVGSDPDSDIAVLKIALKNLPTIEIGDSQTRRIGDVVLAIGNPFGVGQTVTQGIVSAKGRSQLGINLYENFIQTDAAINPGNSGGALIDATGKLIGINTAIFSESGGSVGIGFAIPIELAKSTMDEIIKSGKVLHGWLGFSVQALSEVLKKSFDYQDDKGVLVASVVIRSPAHSAGLKPGDIITKINGTLLKNPQAMGPIMAQIKPGTDCSVEYFRRGKSYTISMKAIARPTAFISNVIR